MDRQVKDLLDDIVNNPDVLEQYTKEQLEEIYKQVNPYGKVLDASNGYTCVSITNLRDRYIANLKMTSLVGFVYRMVKEYDDLYKLEDWEKTEEQQKASKIKQAIIKDFLDRIFEHDPENNVQSAYNPNSADTERTPLETDEKGTPNPVELANTLVPVPTYDAFHRWQWYEEANYDKLREVVNNIYGEKPDLEYAIQIHKQFDSVDDAKKFQQDNGHLTIAPIITLENNAWNLLGSFKENRQRIDFYNKDNQVIQKIMDRVKTDQDYGMKLMKNRVKRKKKKTIAKHGPESADLAKYIKDSGFGQSTILTEEERAELEKFTKKLEEDASGKTTESSTADDNLVPVDPRDVWENVDEDGVPNDAIIVDVFESDGKSLKKSAFFTKAEAPDQKDVLIVK